MRKSSCVSSSPSPGSWEGGVVGHLVGVCELLVQHLLLGHVVEELLEGPHFNHHL